MCKCYNCKCEASQDLEVFIYQLSNKKGELNKRQTYICSKCFNGGHISKHIEKGYYIKTNDIMKKKKEQYNIYYPSSMLNLNKL